MTQDEFTKLAKALEGRPGVTITRDPFGNVTAIDYGTPRPILVDVPLEKPAIPKTIVVAGRSHRKTVELAQTIIRELTDKIPAGQEVQDIFVDPYRSHNNTTVLTVKTGPGRGGHREGSGRKKLGKKVISLRVQPETAETLREVAEETGTNPGAVLDFIVEDYKRKIRGE